MNIRPLGLAFATLLVTFGVATAQTQPSAPAPSATPAPSAAPPAISDAPAGSTAYILGRDDVVEVGLLGRTDFGGRARVQADGTIQLPLIGKVRAADRTTNEVAEDVRKSLQSGGYFSDPVVTVEVAGYASRYVIVLGAVGSPGLLPMNRPYRVSEILARVGGVRESGADYALIVSADGTEKKVFINDMSTGGGEKDPSLKAGDKIFVPPAPTFFIYGQVNSPGELVLRNATTLRMAIAKGGGLTESGSDKKVTITRGGQKTKIKLDDPVEPGDVIVVGERLF